jgi:hypothetical protein
MRNLEASDLPCRYLSILDGRQNGFEFVSSLGNGFTARNEALGLVVAALLGFMPSPVGAQPRHPPISPPASQASHSQPAQQLVRDVVWNEIQAELHDDSYWRYHELQIDHGASKLLDVYQTKYGEIHRVLEIDARPLTPQETRAEEARIQKVVSHPGTIRSAEKEREQDAEEERKLLRLLPNAFIFHEDSHEGSNIKLTFVPNPNFHAADHESEVFHHMEGWIVVDSRVKRLHEISGKLTSPVKFWYGLLGHLDEGGTFFVEQRDVGAGNWELVRIRVDMNGKALFFKTIAVHENETYTDFHEVSGDTPLAQAAEQLKRDTDAMVGPRGT